MRNVAFLGYDFFYSCIENTVNQGFNFKWLYTHECDNIVNFNEKVITLANKTGAIIKRSRITKADIEQLNEQGCDLIISAAYPYKIPILDSMPPTINIHPTLLPEGRGPWPLPVIILKNLKKSGVTIHKVNSEFDSGEILIQEAFTIFNNENLETLSCKVQMIAARILTRLLNNFYFYWDNSKPQKKGSYWRMPSFDDREFNWTMSVEEISRIARAFGKFDSLTKFNNKDWVVQDLTVWREKHNFEIGKVVHQTNREVLIAAKDGLVCLRFFKIDPDFIE